MIKSQSSTKRPIGTADARRLAAVARAAGLGDSPDSALALHREALALLGSDETTPLFADILRWQGSVLYDRGRSADAEPLYRRSLEVSKRLAYDAGCAHALNCLASLAQRRGDLPAAANLLGEALTLADRCGEKRLEGMIQQNFGIIADIRGNAADALKHYLVALQTFEATRDLQPMCWVLNNLGVLHVKEERFEDARAAFDRGLSVSRARGDLMSEGVIEENRAELALIAGAVEAAYPSLRRAYDVADQRGDNVRLAAALKLRGAYERMAGRPADAIEPLQRALALSALGEDALLGGEVLYQFGLALFDCGHGPTAYEVWNAALDAFERIAAPQWVERVRHRLTAGATSRYL